MFRPTLFALALIAAAAPALAQTAEKTLARADLLKNSEDEFRRVDANHDGQMSRTEIETFQSAAANKAITERNVAIFAQFDADKNGQLSVAEFAKLTAPGPTDVTNIMRIDSNKDGKISLAEHRTATLATFDKVDTNKDGILTAAEAQAPAGSRN